MKAAIYALGAAVLALAGAGAAAQSYPTKPIRVIVPFPAGESIDATARLIAQRWQAALGQQMVIDNRGGAGGTIGTELVAKATPDGYTISYGNLGPLSIGPNLYQKLGYDLFRDLAPVSQATSLPFVLFGSTTLPAPGIQELIAYAKSRPGELNYGSTGIGSGLHLMGELFKLTAGVNIVHVPFKGVAQALPEIAAGRLHLAFNTIPAFLPHVKAGRLRAYVITAPRRSSLLPEVPACTEVGLAGLDASAWHGVVAPAGTPREIVARLQRTLAQTLADPEVKNQLAAVGAEPVGSTPEEFAKFMRAESARWARVIKAGGVKVE
ncbi:MAG TPA: tripartite tricarboxylate transporter substrate binding protein [Burkholderiales bacterium]|nr:tripartite tricarboxylate transporter substrate binding protein [Burkholderiales bacterium]